MVFALYDHTVSLDQAFQVDPFFPSEPPARDGGASPVGSFYLPAHLRRYQPWSFPRLAPALPPPPRPVPRIFYIKMTTHSTALEL